MERGYFKVWRKIKDSQSYNRSAIHRAILLTIFVDANWKGGFFCGRQVAPGQIATSVKGLAEELREPRTNVMRALRDLEKDGVIKIENMGNKWTMITLVNWNTYQAQDEKSGQPLVNHRSTSGQPVDTIKEGKKERREEEENTVGPKDGPPPQRGFSGFTIYHQAGAMHISQRDFDSWERAYTNIDLRAELQKLSDWTKTTREWGKKDAFHACSAALAKKNGAAFEAHREQSRPAAMYAVN